MKLLVISSLVILSISVGFAQQTYFSPEKNTDLLNIEFLIKDSTNADTGIINSIDLHQYESLRHQNDRVEIHDKHSGYTLILFSKKEVKNNRKDLPARPYFKAPRSAKKQEQ